MTSPISYRSWRRAIPLAADQLLPFVYDDLWMLATAHLANEQPGQALQPTALVHEAYPRLVGGANPEQWNGRGHFFGAAAIAIRAIECFRAALSSGPAGGCRPLPPSRAESGGESPCRQGCPAVTSTAPPRSSAIAKLACADRKTLVAFRVRGFINKISGSSARLPLVA